MTKLVVTADVHGSLSTWLTIKALLNPGDKLVIAGDLFDTKYGNFVNADFQPESIKKDLKQFKHEFYYVYGNCDIPSFFPGFDSNIIFNAFKRQVFVFHGHRPYQYLEDIDIVIQGHTHIYNLIKKGRQIIMNPGSITYPKRGVATYGVIDDTCVNIVELKTGEQLISIKF